MTISEHRSLSKTTRQHTGPEVGGGYALLAFPRGLSGFYEPVPRHPATQMSLASRAFLFSSGCFDLHQLCLFFCKVATAKSHLEGRETEAQKMKWTLQSQKDTF